MRGTRCSLAFSFALGDANEPVASDDWVLIRERQIAERQRLVEMVGGNVRRRPAHRDLEQGGEFFKRQEFRRMDSHSHNSRLGQ
jgi:hypothetical protein